MRFHIHIVLFFALYSLRHLQIVIFVVIKLLRIVKIHALIVQSIFYLFMYYDFQAIAFLFKKSVVINNIKGF